MKNKIKYLLHVFLVVGTLNFTGESVLAALVTHTFRGTVTSSTGPVFGRNISTGQQVKGSISYNAGLPPQLNNETWAVYYQSPPSEISVVISGVTIKNSAFTTFYVGHNNSGSYDNINGGCSPVVVNGVEQSGQVLFDLMDYTSTALPNTSLPPSIDFLSFNSRSGQVTDGKNGNTAYFSIDLASFEVGIDIKPDTLPNNINPRNQGRIPVAIFTTPSFNVNTINRETVHFGSTGTEATPVQYSIEDIDHDGNLDMVFYFNTQETNIKCGDVFAVLSGTTLDGKYFAGSDSILTVGCQLPGGEPLIPIGSRPI